MEAYKREFIEFLQSAGVLKFGDFTAKHYTRLSEGSCSVTHSPYYTSTVMGLERVADHLVNVGYSIQNPTGSQKEHL